MPAKIACSERISGLWSGRSASLASPRPFDWWSSVIEAALNITTISERAPSSASAAHSSDPRLQARVRNGPKIAASQSRRSTRQPRQAPFQPIMYELHSQCGEDDAEDAGDH